jgi:hypothetical protein
MILSTFLTASFLANSWSIGPELQLKWGGQDYLPVGVQLQPDKSQIDKAIEAGINDFNLEVPISRNWKEAVEGLSNKRFFLTVTSAMPATRGWLVQPQFYRLANIRESQKIRVSLPGAEKSVVVVTNTRSGDIVSLKVVNVEKNGLLTTDVKAVKEADQAVLIYPLTESLELEDLWERMDERRDMVLRQLKQLSSNPGFRGLMNPLGTSPSLPSFDTGMIPISPVFRQEFAEHLDQKYRTIQKAMVEWAMRSPQYNSFSEIARLVPLWNGNRGVGAFFDPTNNQVTQVNLTKSKFWLDYQECLASVRSRRISRLIRSIRKTSDVPVFQEWTGWSWFFENPNNELSGLTTRIDDTSPTKILNATAFPMSSNLRGNRPGALLVTDSKISSEQLTNEMIDQLSDFGVRGVFFRGTDADRLAKIARLKFSQRLVPLKGVYFPQNALNPAFPQRGPFSSWWFPSPNDGRRIDLGPDVLGYEMVLDSQKTFVIWNTGPKGSIDFRLNNAANVILRTGSGEGVPSTLTKTGIRFNLGLDPVIVKGVSQCPIPELELIRVERLVGRNLEVAKSRRQDVSQEFFEFRDFQTQVQNDPQAALETAKRVLDKSSFLLSGAFWGEFESSRSHTFSEVVKDAGCSGGGNLVVKTPFGETQGVLSASLSVPTRTNEPLEMWISAKFGNPSDKERLKVKIGGQTLGIQGEGLSPYGSGFGWYKLGTTRLTGNINELRAEVRGSISTDIALDCILLTPQPFSPQNTKKPEFDLVPVTTDPKKGSGGT